MTLKFDTRIYGLPVYLRAPAQPAPSMFTYQTLTSFSQLTPRGSVEYGTPKVWITERAKLITGNAASWAKWPNDGVNIIDVTQTEKEAELCKVEITTERFVNGRWEHIALIRNSGGRFLFIDRDGLTFTNTPRTVMLITTTATSIRDAGGFLISDPAYQNYASVTYDTSSRPILGATPDKTMASTFRFTWDESTLLKKDIKLFLQTRYFIDHPKLVSDKELLPELEATYDKLGAMIIARITRDRVADEGFTFPLGTDANTVLDDYGHMDKFAPEKDGGDGVDFQRAVMGQDSSAATAMFAPEAQDAGLRRSAEVLLLQAGVQPVAWEKIARMVDPIGTGTNVYPAPVLITVKDGRRVIGVNTAHPFVSGAAGGGDLLFYARPGDGASSGGGGQVVFAVPVSTPLEATSERFCPCGVPGERGGDRAAEPMFDTLFLWILLVLVIVLVVRRACNKEAAPPAAAALLSTSATTS